MNSALDAYFSPQYDLEANWLRKSPGFDNSLSLIADYKPSRYLRRQYRLCYFTH